MTSNFQAITRPEKIDLFMAIACLVSQRSTDAQCACGCVITTKDDRILSTGYNGAPPGTDWTKIPNLRPQKYVWYAHAEDNAIKNMIVSPKVVGGGRAFVTGRACFQCTCDLWSAGIDELFELDGFSTPKIVTSEDEKLKQELIENLALNNKMLSIKTITKTGDILRSDYLETFVKLFGVTAM